ncbi:hypothetical protein Patl1_13849 [Pistacia atlantica]|uniref:Uncharacterized protein n=1 Tax=Pistacia atlantica TaxID=434234 RepID=A0ACC1AYG7_9ROSI|nr:hypothetical protein Patl1_13849 [Pistacia atlantica]
METSTVANLLPLASVSQQPYVSELLSFTLDRLHKEPELLRVDAERIQRQMQEVAVGNYRAFIAAADALLAIREEVSSIDRHLESLITETPKLTSGCTEFIESAEHILENRKMNQTLLPNHSTLLEIPQLMDTCVRNGNYDEALDLEVYVCKLSTMHPNYQNVCELLDIYAELEFLVCMRCVCRAIFADDTSGSEENYDGGLLFSWAMHQITSHLKTLKVMLPKITEGGSLSNILDQCMGSSQLIFKEYEYSSREFSVSFGFPSMGHGFHYQRLAFPANSTGDESQDNVTPPSHLLEHPPLAVFVNASRVFGHLSSVCDVCVEFEFEPSSFELEYLGLGLELVSVSAAMNELRPCAPLSLKHVLAQELIKGLQAVSDSLLRYSATRMLRENESGPFPLTLPSIYRGAFCPKADFKSANCICKPSRSYEHPLLQVAYPHCATCYGRCYPGGAALIMDAKNLYDGIGRLLILSPSKELPKQVNNGEEMSIKEDGNGSVDENRVTTGVEETEVGNEEKEERRSSPVQSGETREL